MIIAVFPLSWEYFGLLFPEALAIPATLAALLAFVGREPTTRVALVTGFLVGVNLLIRPSSGFIALPSRSRSSSSPAGSAAPD